MRDGVRSRSVREKITHRLCGKIQLAGYWKDLRLLLRWIRPGFQPRRLRERRGSAACFFSLLEITGWAKRMAGTNRKISDSRLVSPQESDWDRLSEIYRYEGARRIFLRALKKIFKPIVQIDRLIIGQRDLTIARSGTKARVPLEIRFLRMEEAEVFAVTFNQPAERIRCRLTEGDQCILGIVNNQMVHFQWFVISSTQRRIPIAQTGLALVIHPGEVYSYSAFTLRNWRGNAISAEVSAFKHRYLKSAGCTRKFSYHRADNISSARSFGAKNERSGTTTRTVWVISLFRSRWHWIFGAASDAMFSFVYCPPSEAPVEDGPGVQAFS